MHGKKLSKAEKNILDNTPSDIRTATNAYCQRYCEQYCTLMDKPEGEDIIAINTNNIGIFKYNVLYWIIKSYGGFF